MRKKYFLVLFITAALLSSSAALCMEDDLLPPPDMEEIKPVKKRPVSPKQKEIKKETTSSAPTSDLLTFEQLTAPLKAGTKTNITRKEFEKAAEKLKATYSNIEQEGFYVVKRVVSPGTEIAVHADFHAAKNSIFAFIEKLAKIGYMDEKNKFKIIKQNFYITLLGDILDRGADGLETLYTVMRLKIENPDKVYISRGNHDYHDGGKPNWKTTSDDIMKKLFMNGEETSEILDESICKAWPAALYFGTSNGQVTNYIMMVHGGIEPRFNPNKLLSSNGDRISEKIQLSASFDWLKEPLKKEIEDIVKQRAIKQPLLLGFENCDFYLSDKEPGKYPEIVGLSNERSGKNQTVLAFAQKGAEAFFESCSKPGFYEVKALLRGHQHNDAEKGNTGKFMTAMKNNNGLYGLWGVKQWNGKDKKIPLPEKSVWTFLVSPKVFEQTGNIDTMAIIKTAKEFKDWEFMPIRIDM